MGQCEIVIKRTQEIDDESLFHSDTFLGDEFSDEMYHWKYIKKKKVNGKWRYYYDTTELDKFDREETVKSKKIDKDGNRVVRETEYRKSDKLFSPGNSIFKFSMSPLSGSGSSYSGVTTTKYQGKLSRAYAKAEKKIYNTFYKGKYANQKASSLKHKAAKAKEKIKSWLKIR